MSFGRWQMLNKVASSLSVNVIKYLSKNMGGRRVKHQNINLQLNQDLHIKGFLNK